MDDSCLNFSMVFGNTKMMRVQTKKRHKKRGRPATGRDLSVPARLPEKLIRDIGIWAHSYPGMSRSVAIRCLLRLGLGVFRLQVIDPKNKIIYDGDTPAAAKFYRRAEDKWLIPKGAKRSKTDKDWGPPVVQRSRRRPRVPTKAEINSVVERALARSKKHQ